MTEDQVNFVVSYRRVGSRDTLTGKIWVEKSIGPFDTYEAARYYAAKANSKPFTPFFFFVERSA